MGQIILPKRLNAGWINPSVKPPGPLEIDWTNPITRGLKVALWPTSQGVIDLLQEDSLDPVGVTELSAGKDGIALSGGYSTTGYGAATGLSTGNPFTLMAIVQPTVGLDNSQQHTILDLETNASNRYVTLLFRDNISNPGLRRYRFAIRLGGSTLIILESSEVSLGGSDTVVGVYHSATNRELYINGSLSASTTAAHSGTFEMQEASIGLCRRNGAVGLAGTANPFNGDNYCSFAWARDLSAGEIRNLSDNPYQILKPSAPRIYFFPSGGGGGGTTLNLEATASSLPLSSPEAQLLLEGTLVLNATASGLALSAPDATLVLGVVPTFYDSFDVTEVTYLENRTPDVGTGWVKELGNPGRVFAHWFEGVSYGAYGTETYADGSAVYRINPDLPSADCTLVWRIGDPTTSGDGATTFVAARMTDVNNFVGVRYELGTTLIRKLTKCVGGVFTDLTEGVSPNHDQVDDEWVKLEVVGSAVRMYTGGTGATPSWVQQGSDQTYSENTTETSVGFVIVESGLGGSHIARSFQADTYAVQAALSLEATASALPLSAPDAQLLLDKTLVLNATAPGVVLGSLGADLVLSSTLSLEVSTDTLALSAPSAQLLLSKTLALSPNATTLALSAPAAELDLIAYLGLETEASSLSLAAPNAQLLLEGTLALNATAPGLALSAPEAQLEINAYLDLQASVTGLALSAPNAQLLLDGPLALNASATALPLAAPDAQLDLNALLSLEATPGSTSLDAPDAQLLLDTVLALNATAPSTPLAAPEAGLTLYTYLGLQSIAPALPLSAPSASLFLGATLAFSAAASELPLSAPNALLTTHATLSITVTLNTLSLDAPDADLVLTPSYNFTQAVDARITLSEPTTASLRVVVSEVGGRASVSEITDRESVEDVLHYRDTVQ